MAGIEVEDIENVQEEFYDSYNQFLEFMQFQLTQFLLYLNLHKLKPHLFLIPQGDKAFPAKMVHP